ncbi:glycoside hydrolase family 88 protein [Paenibacillus alkalitolerans]|uniref:glycoside hydrolase family 88 protein n=1 Tax=Paenibacillus alkalitolerans TaxID=2799335 RepID=UPI0018F5D605|nr:glycoside hydrolase family 88 protein [Paenibacillus alkalitolerans]
MTFWEKAIEDAAVKTKQNIERFNGLFPHVSNGDEVYELNDNNEWTNGFWCGILWLCYEYTGDETFKKAAERSVQSFGVRLARNRELDHHDIGFLYSLSAKAQWMIERDEKAKEIALGAADVLLKRWRPKGGYIQAWGSEGHPENGGRIIIDCLLNLPLLYWAGEQTGNPVYRDVAVKHTEKSRRFLVRGDDSTYHTFYFNPENGEAIRGGTHQGYTDGSVWTRGQAWGIYGFALSYRYTGNVKYLETAKRLAKFFAERIPEDGVVYWDFDAPVRPGIERDSSASAIAACGMLEIVGHLNDGDPDMELIRKAALWSVESLAERHSTIDQPDAQGLIKHGSYSVRIGHAPDDYTIWGDYYYLEALMRLAKGHKGYWYE